MWKGPNVISPVPNSDRHAEVGVQRRAIFTLPLLQLLSNQLTLRGMAALPALAGMALAPRTAHAEPVTVCLAVASAVAGLIAANNRSDGGMSAVMLATLEYQRAMAGQLASLQAGMAEVLEKLSALPMEVQTLLHRDRLAQLHARLGREVLRYQHEATTRAGTFSSYQAWAADSLTRDEMTDVSRMVSDTVTEVKRGRWLDSLTALYLPASVFAYLGVRSVLGEAPEQQAAQAQRYLDIFDLIEDPDESGSTAADLVTIADEIKQRARELAKMGFKVPSSDEFPPQEVQVGRVAVQDYTARTLVERRSDCRLINPRHPDFGEKCWDTSIYSPERSGERDTIGFFATVKPGFIEARHGMGDKISLRTFEVASGLTLKKIQDLQAPSVPAQEIRVDAKTFDARLAAAKSSAQFTEAIAARDRLDLTVGRLNQLLARSALDAAALSAISSTRQALFRYFDKGA